MNQTNKHREPTLFIVGKPNRHEEIRHIIEDEWGGLDGGNGYYDSNTAYYINSFGYVSNCSANSPILKHSIKNGWMKEYKLPEKIQKTSSKSLINNVKDSIIKHFQKRSREKTKKIFQTVEFEFIDDALEE